jgi:transposase
MMKLKKPLKKTQSLINNIGNKGDTKVLFFDEGRFGLRSTTMRIWAEKGKRLRVQVQQGFKNFYGYTAVCPFDGSNFTLLMPGVNTLYMSKYLEKLSAEYKNYTLIIFMDQAGWHKSKDLHVPNNITIEFLPPYSPELNPIEKLWEWIKKERSHNFVYKDLESLQEAVCDEYKLLTDEKMKKLCACSYMNDLK